MNRKELEAELVWSCLLPDAIEIHHRSSCWETAELVYGIFLESCAANPAVTALIENEPDEDGKFEWFTLTLTNAPEKQQKPLLVLTTEDSDDVPTVRVSLLDVLEEVKENEELAGIVVNPQSDPFLFSRSFISSVVSTRKEILNKGFRMGVLARRSQYEKENIE